MIGVKITHGMATEVRETREGKEKGAVRREVKEGEVNIPRVTQISKEVEGKGRDPLTAWSRHAMHVEDVTSKVTMILEHVP